MAFSFESLIPSMGSFSLGSFIKVLLYGSIIGGGLGFGIKFIRDKIKYQYFGLIFRRRQSLEYGVPESKVVWGKAGYFTKRSGKSTFKIKYGLMPWQQVELSKLPDPKHMIDKIVAYEQLNKDNLVQCRMNVDWDGGLDIQPVEDDLKYGAMLDIYDKGRTLENKILSPTVIGMMILGIILTAGIIVFYFLGKA
jgi:hypothetical protein